jgi:hypothetical protein
VTAGVGVRVDRLDPQAGRVVPQKDRQRLLDVEPALPRRPRDAIVVPPERMKEVEEVEIRVNENLDAGAPSPPDRGELVEIGSEARPGTRVVKVVLVELVDVRIRRRQEQLAQRAHSEIEESPQM